MRWLVSTIVGALILMVVVIVLIDPTTQVAAAVGPADPALIARGEYLARASDCAACHSTPGGKPYAGGLAFELPIGTIYSTNITPDPEQGIGRYTLDDFASAIRRGVARDGHPLYPAMPYPSYAVMPDDDVAAMYAYFMLRVAAVPEASPKNAVHWPMSIRWPINFWRWAFAPTPGKGTAANPDPVIARGAYLVEGPGHCGACHTPRGIALQEKALSDADGPTYLSGAVVEHWVATSLRGEPSVGLGGWSEQEIREFLGSGRTSRSAVFGGMSDVVEHSTQYMTDDDLTAIARYLKTLPATDARDVARPYDDAVPRALQAGDESRRGAAVFIDSCAACHRTDGKGYAGVFPALAGNSAVVTADSSSLVQIVLKGGRMPATARAPAHFAMPPFAWRLNDQEIADVATFVRRSWGNDATAVSPSEVAKLRKETKAAEFAGR